MAEKFGEISVMPRLSGLLLLLVATTLKIETVRQKNRLLRLAWPIEDYRKYIDRDQKWS